jgi:hypothetical protein
MPVRWRNRRVKGRARELALRTALRRVGPICGMALRTALRRVGPICGADGRVDPHPHRRGRVARGGARAVLSASVPSVARGAEMSAEMSAGRRRRRRRRRGRWWHGAWSVASRQRADETLGRLPTRRQARCNGRIRKVGKVRVVPHWPRLMQGLLVGGRIGRRRVELGRIRWRRVERGRIRRRRVELGRIGRRRVRRRVDSHRRSCGDSSSGGSCGDVYSGGKQGAGGKAPRIRRRRVELGKAPRGGKAPRALRRVSLGQRGARRPLWGGGARGVGRRAEHRP